MFIVIALTFDHFSAAVENAFHPTQYPYEIYFGYCYLYKCYNNTAYIFRIIFSSINVDGRYRLTNLNKWKEDW